MKDIARFSKEHVHAWRDKHTAKLSLEKSAYQQFQRLFKTGHFQGQRRGQAFYNHFRLHRLTDQDQLKGLYEKDGDEAVKVIETVFQFD